MWLEILLPALVGGCLAGAISLVVGGVGGMYETRRAVTNLASIVGDLQVQVQREVKRRAGDEGLKARMRGDPLVEALAEGAQAPPGSTIGRGAATSAPPRNGAEVLARARAAGIVR